MVEVAEVPHALPAMESQTAAEAVPAVRTLLEASKEEEKKALAQLRLIFDAIDVSKSGSVDKDELSVALREDQNLGALFNEAGLDDVWHVLSQLDSNEDHHVSWDEFEAHLRKTAVEEVVETGHIAAAERLAEEKALAQLRAIFDGLDTDADGTVSKAEFAARLQKDMGGEDDDLGRFIEQAGLNPEWSIVDALDTNGNGRITWKEFETHLRKAAIEVVLEDMAAAHCCCCYGPL